MPATMTDWSAIEALPQTPLTDLFAGEADRLEKMVIEYPGIRFDFSKTHLSTSAIAAFIALAEQAGFAEKREALFAGDIVNPSEGRPQINRAAVATQNQHFAIRAIHEAVMIVGAIARNHQSRFSLRCFFRRVLNDVRLLNQQLDDGFCFR